MLSDLNNNIFSILLTKNRSGKRRNVYWTRNLEVGLNLI